MKYIRIRKNELPLPIVIEGENGELRVMEIAPANPSRLGASMHEASKMVRDAVMKLLGKR